MLQLPISEILNKAIALLGLGGIAFILYLMMNRKGTVVVPPTPPVPPVVDLPPAPGFMGFYLGKPLYGFGERIILNVGKECHGVGDDCNAQSHGLIDNLSGPYLARLRVFVKRTGAELPVYGYDGGARCDNVWQPVVSGRFQEVYALGVRPYSSFGSLVNCNEFVPYDQPQAAPRACGCYTPPTTGGLPSTVPVEEIVLEVQFQNVYGVIGAPWRQSTFAQTSSCA